MLPTHHVMNAPVVRTAHALQAACSQSCLDISTLQDLDMTRCRQYIECTDLDHDHGRIRELCDIRFCMPGSVNAMAPMGHFPVLD